MTIVCTNVLIKTIAPSSMDDKLSFSPSHTAAIGSPKKVIKKLENATYIAYRRFNAEKNKIIDKKLRNRPY